MKKIYLLICITLIGFSSCKEDFITRDNPLATKDDDFWRTKQQLDAVVTAIYGGLPIGAFYYNTRTYMSYSAMTDDAAWTGNFFEEIPTIALGTTTPSTEGGRFHIWRDNYAKIRLANRFLHFAPGALVDSEVKVALMTEVRALRAWYHLELFTWYGPIPIVTESVSLENSNLKRNTKEEVLDFILSELDACALSLPLAYNGNDIDRITKGAVLTMKTYALLTAERYADCAAAARKVMDLGIYSLYVNSADPKSSYINLFSYATQTVNPERILFRRRVMAEVYYRSAPPSVGGTSALNPTAALVNAYETKQGKLISELGTDSLDIYTRYPNYRNNRDPRLIATVFYPGIVFNNQTINPFDNSPTNVNRLGAINSTRTGYWAKKAVTLNDVSQPFQGTLDFAYFRYANVLLMYVEGLVESGQWNHPDVILYLNQIRNRAAMPNVDVTVYNSEAKIRELYRRERRIELALEGHRYFDIRRWKIGPETMNGIVRGATNPLTGEVVLVERRKFESKNNLLPIPIYEMQSNSNMVQNPG